MLNLRQVGDIGNQPERLISEFSCEHSRGSTSLAG
jgi:hypothetical protein